MQADLDPEVGVPAVLGVNVTIKDLAFTVPKDGKRSEGVKLLQGVTADFHAGQLTALMGPSGSGKTTLLDIMAGRKTTGKVDGELLFANQRPSLKFFRRCIGYVEQFDTLIGNLTVTEMLLYTAELKNPTSMSRSEKHAKVNDVIEKLSLTSCKDVKIGTQLSRGISGGQAKRTNIGIALVSATTKVLLLDEPTSGLDSYTATEVMKVVKGLASSSITICATIHSPTPATFKLFDRTMILLRGQLVYFGSVGQVITYFQETNPEFPRIGSGAEGVADNIAEWVVDLTTQADSEGKAAAFADTYRKSTLCMANKEAVDAAFGYTKSKANQLDIHALSMKRATTVGSIPGFWTIVKYRSRRDFTDPQYLGPRLAERVLLGFILMSLYWHKCKSNEATNINNVYSVLFLISILPGFTASAYIPVIVLERPLYYRELDDGLYRPITYLCAKLAGEFVIAIIGSLVFSCFVFFALELHGSYLLFLLVHYLTTAIGIVLAYFIASISPDLGVANAALPAYITTLLFFVGLLIRPADTPAYWHWYVNLDFLRYGWRAHMINQFEGQNAIFVDNIEVLAYFGITGSKWMWFGLEWIFGVVFFIFALLGLTYVRHQKR